LTVWLVMKASKVAFLLERGLRRVCGPDPQGCEPQFKQHERKTDAIKTYLLKNSATVEHKPARSTRSTCDGIAAPHAITPNDILIPPARAPVNASFSG
jgi:hypothetical protein